MGKRKQASVSHAATDDLSNLEALLSDVTVEGDESDEVVEGLFAPEAGLPAEFDMHPQDIADEAVREMLALETSAEEVVVDESAPEVTEVVEAAAPVVPSVKVDPVVEAKRAAKAAAKAAKLAEKAEKAEAAKAARAAKAAALPPKAARVFYGKNKVARLRATLGDKLGDYMVLTLDDAALEGEALKAKQDETLAVIDAMGIKVKNRATNLLEFAAGKSIRINNVIATALQVLARDGQLTTGDRGNLFTTLLAKPYAPSAARAMGNNTLNMLRQLKLTDFGLKGVYVANPESLLLAFVAEKLSLSFGEQDEGDAEDELVEVGTEDAAEVAAA